MNDIQQILVRDHIDALLSEGVAIRTERRIREARGDPRARASTDRRSVRVRARVGRLIVGVGLAVAGASAEPRDRVPGRAA